MKIFIWVLQGLICFTFLYSGICKAYFDEGTLVERGQTGVEGLSMWFIKFIGISEVLGSIGLVLPEIIEKYLLLVPISAACLGAIMLPAAAIHFRRREYFNVGINVTILIICIVIAVCKF